MLTDKQLVSFLNWSEIENSTQIWKGILDDILPAIVKPVSKPFFFSDFSDCSRKSKQEINSAINLLGRFRDYFQVNLSLNQNEASLLAKALDISYGMPDKEFVEELYGKSNADVLIIHRTKDALAYNGDVYEQCNTFFCEEPKILTGGGDNFNAGFCYSLFHNFNLFQSLLLANAVSGSYVKSGMSPDVENLIKFLEDFSR
jgi:hypothetical protein